METFKIQVKVKPGSREAKFVKAEGDMYEASVRARPVDGKANSELIELVAGHFGLRKSQVQVKSGSKGRIKILELG